MENTNMWVIEATSGAHSGACVLGEGATEASAWADAFGPKPWTPYQKRAAKAAWARQLEDGEIPGADGSYLLK
jgi:hypothetical protein